MFLKWNEIILVQDHAKRQAHDPIVYMRSGFISEQKEVHEETFWPAFDETMRIDYEKNGMRQYGTIYQDANEQWCIVPYVWNEDDAMRAKDWIVKQNE